MDCCSRLAHVCVIFFSRHQAAASCPDPRDHLRIAAGAGGSLLHPVPQIPEPGEILVSSSAEHPGTNKRGQCADARVTCCDPGTQAVGENGRPGCPMPSKRGHLPTHIRSHRISSKMDVGLGQSLCNTWHPGHGLKVSLADTARE